MPRRGADRAEVDALLGRMGVSTNNPEIFTDALRHRSVLNESSAKQSSNERLEFLGDSVLGAAVSEYLYTQFPDLNEGQLARKKSALVSETSLAAWASHYEMGRYLELGKGEEQTGGREKQAILADAFEAVLGALFMDQGWKAAQDFIFRCVQENPLARGVQKTLDAKSRLQEWSQKLYKKPPFYRLLKTEGPDHAKEFEVEVLVGGQIIARGKGKTKKEAEQDGASRALDDLVHKEA